MVRRTRRQWAELVAEFRRSGQGPATFAARRGLNVNTLNWWRSRLRDEAEVGFAMVELMPPAHAPVVRIEAELSSGLKVGVEVPGERALLDAVFAVLDMRR